MQLRSVGGGGCCGGPSPAGVGEDGAGSARSTAAASMDSNSSAAALYPPPHLLTKAHEPTAGSDNSTSVLLHLKRNGLFRLKCSSSPLPRSGQPAEEVDNPPLAADFNNPEIDMNQFKHVRMATPAGPGKLHKLYVEFYPSHTYKLKVSSAIEAQVWYEIFQSYGNYREYGTSNGVIAEVVTPRSLARLSPDGGPLTPYYAYTIPSIYTRTIQALFAHLIQHKAVQREGLFRTGKSSPLLIRQILLNGGVVDDELMSRGRPIDSNSSSKLDLHCVAFCAKNLLRSLPETLFTNALIHPLFESVRSNDSCRVIAILHFLPSSNYQILQTLFEVVYLTTLQPTSRMTIESLTKVVGPNLLPKDDAVWIRAMTNGTSVATNHIQPHSDASNKNDPLPGSVPMQKLFEMIIDLGSEIFPRSHIFNPDGNNDNIPSPIRISYTHADNANGINQRDASHAPSAASAAAAASSSSLPAPLLVDSGAPHDRPFVPGCLSPIAEGIREYTGTTSNIGGMSSRIESHNESADAKATGGITSAPGSPNELDTLAASSATASPTTPTKPTINDNNNSDPPPSSYLTPGPTPLLVSSSGGLPPLTASPKPRAPEFEREVEREIVEHTFPTFHFEEDEQ